VKRGGPLKRRAPLKRGSAQLARTPIRSSREKHTDPAWREEREKAFRRDGYRCMVTVEHDCTRRAEHAHHVILRSQGGPDVEWNLLSVCHVGHRWIHDHPRDARRYGWIRSGMRRQ
jgi:5-methylcytosine-specific restriction endonuclease McrA